MWEGSTVGVSEPIWEGCCGGDSKLMWEGSTVGHVVASLNVGGGINAHAGQG